MKNLPKLAILLVLLLVGCRYHTTSPDSSDPRLRPRIVSGSLSQVRSKVYKAALKAFPDETSNITIDGSDQVIILREWLMRGDSRIVITIDRINNYKFEVNARSEVSNHRMNPVTLGSHITKNELLHYLNVLDREY